MPDSSIKSDLIDHNGPHLHSRNVTINGRRTSMRLEPIFWEALSEIAAAKHMTISELCTLLKRRRGRRSMTSHIRLFVIEHFRNASVTLAPQSPAEHHRDLVA